MMCVWWNYHGVIHYELVPNGRAVNADLYSEQLERVHQVIRQLYPALVNRGRVLLQHDNARPHVSRRVREKSKNWVALKFSLILLIAPTWPHQTTISFGRWPIFCAGARLRRLKMSKMDAVNSLRVSPESGTREELKSWRKGG